VVTFSTDQSQIRHLEPVFERDLKFARRVLEQRLIFHEDYAENNEVLNNPVDITDFLKYVRKEEKPFALDWETKGLKPYNDGNYIISCGIALSDDKSYTFMVENYWETNQTDLIKQELKLLLESNSGLMTKIFHNYKFEKLWSLERLNADIQNNIIDTQYLAYILNETRGTHSLDHLSFVNFGLEKIKEADKYKSDMSLCPEELLHKYNGLDAKLTFKLFEKLSALLDEKDWSVYKILLEGADATLKSEMEGVIVNKSTLKKNKIKVRSQKKTSEVTLRNLDEVKNFEKKHDKKINLNSSQQISKIMFGDLKLNGFKKTATGAESCDAEVLQGYKDVPFCKSLLEYRKASKLLSTYLEGFEENIHDDGLVHTTYNLTFTETGRLSSQSPNLQNIPKREDAFIREMFVVPEDHYLMSFDYSGAEVRCMAMESKDKELIRQINDNYDMHQFWADRLSIISKKEVSRFDSKNGFVFPSFYGAGHKSIAKNLEIDQTKIEKAQKELFTMYPNIKRWQKRLEQFYNRHHYVESLLGRKRHAPLDYNQMINTPVQSLASDLCLLSMIEASREGYKIPLIIHDDITLYVHKDNILRTYKRIKKIMTNWDFDFVNVNLEIECCIGKNWYEQKELKLEKKCRKQQKLA
jgi:DNA polymerase-1